MALAGLLLAVAADAALVYSWPYGLPAATAQASYGTSERNNMFAVVQQRLRRYYTAVIPRNSWLTQVAALARM